MKVMKVYFITDQDLGKTTTLYPRRPKSAPKTEPNTPRICCCPTILGCIHSIEAVYNYPSYMPDEYNADIGFNLWVYTAMVDVDKLFQPHDMVNDSWRTGELWILESQEFTLDGRYRLRRHMRIDSTFSRYAFYREGDEGGDEVVDRWIGRSVYGDRDSFSFIELAHDLHTPEWLNRISIDEHNRYIEESIKSDIEWGLKKQAMG